MVKKCVVCGKEFKALRGAKSCSKKCRRQAKKVIPPMRANTPHLNRSRVKQTALDIAKLTRGQKFERVGRTFLERIEAATRAQIAHEVRIHPSKGKTLL